MIITSLCQKLSKVYFIRVNFPLDRSLGNTSANETTTNTTTLDFVPAKANFSIIIITTGCRTWDNDNNSWTMDGCTVKILTEILLYVMFD